MTSKINIDSINYDLKIIENRSKVLQILKNKMKCCDDDYISIEGDFKLETEIVDINLEHLNLWWNNRSPKIKKMIYLKWFNQL